MIEQSQFRNQWGDALRVVMADHEQVQAVHHGATVRVATMIARNGDHVDIVWNHRGFGLQRGGEDISGATRSLKVLECMVDNYPPCGPVFEGNAPHVPHQTAE